MYKSGTSASARRVLTRFPRPALFLGVKPQGELLSLSLVSAAEEEPSANMEEVEGLVGLRALSSSKRDAFGREPAASSSSPKSDIMLWL
jgi:hypothetical protein